jgi:crossover junction endodeoxyribonuclease RuvC
MTRNLRRSATDPGRSLPPATVVLGIDPGTLVTGFGVVARRGTAVKLIAAGTITNSSRTTIPERLHAIFEKLQHILSEHHPNECAIESAFYGKNAQSALKLGHARGVCLLAAVQYGLTPAEYSPREVKRAVVGNGNASKEQVQFMVKALLGLKNEKMAADASDAIAIALCHLQRKSRPSAPHRDWRAYIEAHPEKVRP